MSTKKKPAKKKTFYVYAWREKNERAWTLFSFSSMRAALYVHGDDEAEPTAYRVGPITRVEVPLP